MHHTWSPDAARGLQLTTQRKDPSVNGGWVKGSKVYVPAFENALSKMAKEKAHEFMHAKRETAKRSASPSDKEEGGQEEEGQDEGVGPRRSGRAKTKSKRLHDQGYRSSSSGEEEGESESDVESDVDGSEEEYTEREMAGRGGIIRTGGRGRGGGERGFCVEGRDGSCREGYRRRQG